MKQFFAEFFGTFWRFGWFQLRVLLQQAWFVNPVKTVKYLDFYRKILKH